jgi:Domain of unknown function (DUF4249)
MKRITVVGLIFFLLDACNPVPEVASDNYVVQAYVFAGDPVREVTIKKLIPLDQPEGKSEIIKTALVKIIKEGKSFPLTFNPATNKYRYTGLDLDIMPLDVLDLEVDVNGRIAEAMTVVPESPTGLLISKTQMVIPKINSILDFIGNDPLADAELTVTWDKQEDILYYTVIEFRSNLLIPILPGDVQEVVDGILEDFAIITAPSTDTILMVNGALLPSYGPYIVKIYQVNKEYAELYGSETQDSRDLNQPPSNIINAQGIFSAFASDSIFFEVVKP